MLRPRAFVPVIPRFASASTFTGFARILQSTLALEIETACDSDYSDEHASSKKGGKKLGRRLGLGPRAKL